MNIQPLNNNLLADVTPQRQQNAAPKTAPSPTPLPNDAVQNAQAAPIAPQEAQTSREQVNTAVKATNDFVSLVNNSLEFSVDDDTKITVVKVVDKKTGDIVRQIPSEEMLAIAKALDTIKGLLIHQKA